MPRFLSVAPCAVHWEIDVRQVVGEGITAAEFKESCESCLWWTCISSFLCGVLNEVDSLTILQVDSQLDSWWVMFMYKEPHDFPCCLRTAYIPCRLVVFDFINVVSVLRKCIGCLVTTLGDVFQHMLHALYGYTEFHVDMTAHLTQQPGVVRDNPNVVNVLFYSMSTECPPDLCCLPSIFW